MTEYTDDATIQDEAELWRRIPPWHVVVDDNLGRKRPSSAAFENHPNGTPMSVLLGEIVAETGRGPGDVLAAYENFALVCFTAGLARMCGQRVARDPLPEEPAHALVVGAKPKSVQKRFARDCHWVLPPIDVAH